MFTLNGRINYLERNTLELYRMYAKGDKIGSGTFSDVFVGAHILDPLHGRVALKVHKYKDITSPESDEISPSTLIDLSYTVLMDHPNVIKQIAHAYMDPNIISTRLVIQPLVYVRKNASEFIKEYNYDCDIRMIYADNIIMGVMRGLTYIHACGFIHRDVKLTNTLVEFNANIADNDVGAVDVRIIDFGIAIYIGPGYANRLQYQNLLSGENAQSLYYRAPEITLGLTYYDKSIDVWSTGMMYLELLNWKMNDKEPMSMFGSPEHWISPEEFVPLAMRNVSVENNLMCMLQYYPEKRTLAKDYIRRDARDARNDWDPASVGDTILQKADIVVAKSYYYACEKRFRAIHWIINYFTEYNCCDNSIVCHVLYAIMRMFDYYTSKHTDINTEEEVLQKILSCCVGIQLKLRNDYWNSDYVNIAQYGEIITSDELYECEQEMLSRMNFSCFISTPIDYLDQWAFEAQGDLTIYADARKMCVQTMHYVPNVTLSAFDIAFECYSAVKNPQDSTFKGLIEIYHNDPLIVDKEYQKIIFKWS
jgi:serine/threonine protein kinase